MNTLSKKRFSLRQVIVMLAIVISGIAVISYGAVTIPNTFSSGDTISSSEVNQNFTAVKTAIDSMNTPLAYGVFNVNAIKISGTSNITCTWNEAGEWYQCSIDDENFSYDDYIVNVMPIGNPYIATIGGTGELIILFYNTDGNDGQRPNYFSVIVYKI